MLNGRDGYDGGEYLHEGFWIHGTEIQVQVIARIALHTERVDWSFEFRSQNVFLPSGLDEYP